MRVLIPARTNSTRVPNKNYKPFWGKMSLFDIKAKQLLEVFNPKDVFVSVEKEEVRPLVEKYGFHFLLRSDELCTVEGEKRLNQQLVDMLPSSPDEEIMYISVTDPFFSEFGRVMQTWNRVKRNYDSLMVVRRLEEQVLFADGSPANFDFFGQATQCLKSWYSISMCTLVSTRQVVKEHNHYIGKSPYMFTARQKGVDVDDADSWQLAQLLYLARYGRPVEEGVVL